jgi:hypothetical protein
MELCLLNINKLKKFVLNSFEQESQVVTFNVGGYEYQFHFVIHEIKIDESKARKLKVRWDVNKDN